MLYVDPNTGASFLVFGEPNVYMQPLYLPTVNLEAQTSTPLATNLGEQQQAYGDLVSNQGYSATLTAQSDVDELIGLTNLLYQQEEVSSTDQEQVAELATDLQNSLPSSPLPLQAEEESMHRREKLPGINSLTVSEELSNLLAPLSNIKQEYPFPSITQRLAPQPSLVLPPLPPRLPSLPSLTHPAYQHQPVQHIPAHHSSVHQHQPAHHIPALHAPAHHSHAHNVPAQHGPAQHGPAQHGPAQHSHAHQHQPAHHGPAHHTSPAHKHQSAQRRPAQHSPEQVSVSSPETSPCSTPPQSPKRSKKNYTKEFNIKFHELLNQNEHATNEWHIYAQRHRGRCTIKRSPCIKVSRGFCAAYGHEFSDLAKEEKYGALGTRTECGCMHKSQPLSSSSTGPSKKQRQPARSTPYPAQPPQNQSPTESTPTGTPSMTRQAWSSFLHQSAPMLQEGLNTFMGGFQCAVCHVRRAIAGRDDVIAYLMREPISCTQDSCVGHMQIHQ